MTLYRNLIHRELHNHATLLSTVLPPKARRTLQQKSAERAEHTRSTTYQLMELSQAMPLIEVVSKHQTIQIGKVLRLQKLEAALLTQLNDPKASLAQSIRPQTKEKTLTSPCSRRYIRTWWPETMSRCPL